MYSIKPHMHDISEESFKITLNNSKVYETNQKMI